ncbi:MAG: hypothetical protein QXT63_08450 [Thermoplasmata archaeon]
MNFDIGKILETKKSCGILDIVNIGKEDPDAVLPGLLKAFDHQDDTIRGAARNAFEELRKERELLPSIFRCLNYSDVSVQNNATKTLTNMGINAENVPIASEYARHLEDALRLNDISRRLGIPDNESGTLLKQAREAFARGDHANAMSLVQRARQLSSGVHLTHATAQINELSNMLSDARKNGLDVDDAEKMLASANAYLAAGDVLSAMNFVKRSRELLSDKARSGITGRLGSVQNAIAQKKGKGEDTSKYELQLNQINALLGAGNLIAALSILVQLEKMLIDIPMEVVQEAFRNVHEEYYKLRSMGANLPGVEEMLMQARFLKGRAAYEMLMNAKARMNSMLNVKNAKAKAFQRFEYEVGRDVRCVTIGRLGDRDVIIAGSSSGVDVISSSGKLLWRHNIGAAVTDVAIGKLDGKDVIVASAGGRLFVLSALSDAMANVKQQLHHFSLLGANVGGVRELIEKAEHAIEKGEHEAASMLIRNAEDMLSDIRQKMNLAGSVASNVTSAALKTSKTFLP